MKTGLDIQQWKTFCRDAAATAAARCDSSYRRFIEMFSDLIEQRLIRLPDQDRIEAYLIARRWDYQTPIERAMLVRAI